jgi:hypothetical protein
MDERDIKDIYSMFIAFAIIILFYGSSFKEIMQIMNILATTNILITSVNIPSIHIPFYIKVAIAILLIPMIIDILYNRINMSKIVKTPDEELDEIAMTIGKVLIIITTILLLILS